MYRSDRRCSDCDTHGLYFEMKDIDAPILLPDGTEATVTASVIIWKCEACKFAFRDGDAEVFVDKAVTAYKKRWALRRALLDIRDAVLAGNPPRKILSIIDKAFEGS